MKDIKANVVDGARLKRSEIEDRVILTIREKLGLLDHDEVKMGTDLKNDLCVDSLEYLEIIMDSENMFGIKLIDLDDNMPVTVGDLVTVIADRLNVKD